MATLSRRGSGGRSVEWAICVRSHRDLREWDTRPDVVEQVVLEAKYSGYVDRQAAEVERFRRMEDKRNPATVRLRGHSAAARRGAGETDAGSAASLGQASRISGITPADLAVLLFYLE